MKKTKLLSLLTGLLLVLGFNIASAQTNTFTRVACNPNFQGCVSTSLSLTLTDPNPPQFAQASQTKALAAPGSVDFAIRFTKIKVSLGGYTSTGTYYLPTTIGDGTAISIGADGEGVGPYTIYIYKSGSNSFTVSVGNTAL
ncbi:hypothetical protein F0919_07100 [Taibaiella lutea]|uniref:Uncharacterized protein n=1 Tax=Taibaiella lutea TaxID=2608001 RepID=A0A5M6CX01_9BACT|nr:hypothetical protein [Taibaiella lutea]KAA5537435.1 hypothetical protein F0919_07100 [Taibaiella lutea]